MKLGLCIQREGYSRHTLCNSKVLGVPAEEFEAAMSLR